MNTHCDNCLYGDKVLIKPFDHTTPSEAKSSTSDTDENCNTCYNRSDCCFYESGRSAESEQSATNYFLY